MTETDPNVTTTPEGETVVLEPGDPGYVEPVIQETPPGEPNAVLDPQPMPADAPAPQDLTYMKEAGESDAEFLIRSREVVESENPTDIVPNTPQIRPFPSEVIEEPEPEPEPEAPPEEEPAPEPASA